MRLPLLLITFKAGVAFLFKNFLAFYFVYSWNVFSIMRILVYLSSKLLINREMLKVVTFMKQVARGLQMGGNFGTAHVYRSSLNAIIAYCGKEDFTFYEVSPEWLKGFEVHLRSRGCSWNTVSTYLRTFRAVYNRAVDLRKAPYVPHLFRSVYTGTRADHKRALGEEDIKKVFARLSQAFVGSPSLRKAQELFILMFLLRGLPLSISPICVKVIYVTM